MNDARRGSASERGYGARWRALRAEVLEEQPLCRCDLHQGREDAPASTVVDHVIPHRGDQELFWKRSNLRGMAKRCHDMKTAREDGAFGNPLKQQAIA